MSFEAPLFLGLLALALPVLLAFLVKRRQATLVVPSILRWRNLSVARHRSRRLRNLRRWLALAACLAAILALAFATARPHGAGTGQTLFVVVDVSPSMGDAAAGPLSEAIARIEALASSMGARDRIAIIAAGPAPERLLAPTNDAARVRAAAARLAPRERGDLPAAVRLADELASAEAPSRILLLHDGGSSFPAGVRGVETRRPLLVDRLGGGRENVGVTLFALQLAADGTREVSVGVVAAGERPRRVAVALFGHRVGATPSGTERELARREVEIPSGEEVDLRFPIRAPVGSLRVSITPIDGLGDDLATDDSFTLVIPDRGRRPPVRWMHPETSALELLETAPAGDGSHTLQAAVGSTSEAVASSSVGHANETLRFFAERALRAAGVEDFGPLVAARSAGEPAEPSAPSAPRVRTEAGAPSAATNPSVGTNPSVATNPSAPAEVALEGEGGFDLPDDAIVVSLGAPSRRVAAPLLVLGGAAPPEREAPHNPGHPHRPRYGHYGMHHAAPTTAVPTAHWPIGVRPLDVLVGDATALRRVDDRHPIMRDISLDGVTILRAHPIDPGAGAPLGELDGSTASADAGIVVAAGGEGPGRWVYVGLDPSGSDVVLRVAYPMLVANALDWLAGGAEVHAATTPRVEEVTLQTEDDDHVAFVGPSLPLPPLPWLLAALAALLLAFEGLAYARRVVD